MRMAVPVCAPGTRRLRRLHPNDASGRAKRRRPPAQGRTVRPCPQLLLAREPCSLLCITVLAPDLLLYRVALGRAPPYSPRAHREAVSSSQTFSRWRRLPLVSDDALVFRGRGPCLCAAKAPASPSPGRTGQVSPAQRSVHPRLLLSLHSRGSEPRSEIQHLHARKTVKQQNHQPRRSCQRNQV